MVIYKMVLHRNNETGCIREGLGTSVKKSSGFASLAFCFLATLDHALRTMILGFPTT